MDPLELLARRARRLGHLDIVVVSAAHLVIGGFGLAVAAFVVEGTPEIAWTPRFLAVVTFLGLVATAATTLAWFVEAQRHPLSTLTPWMFLVPIVGLVLGVVLLGERPGGWTIAATAEEGSVALRRGWDRLFLIAGRQIVAREGVEVLALATAAELRARFELGRLVFGHRLGRLAPGEASIVIVASSAHRKDALLATHAAIDRLKELLPVWKLEATPDGAQWVEGSSAAAETL